MCNNQRKGFGFTLVELVILMLVAVILLASITVLWPSSKINLEAQSYLLGNDIRYAQNLSMSRGERFRFVKLTSNSYRITDSTGTAVVLPFGGSTITFDTGISFGVITNLPNNLIVFDSKGVPYTDTASPGTRLADVAVINLVTMEHVKTISISPETGRVLM